MSPSIQETHTQRKSMNDAPTKYGSNSRYDSFLDYVCRDIKNYSPSHDCLKLLSLPSSDSTSCFSQKQILRQRIVCKFIWESVGSIHREAEKQYRDGKVVGIKGSIVKSPAIVGENGTKLTELLLPKGQAWRRQWHPTPVLLPGKSHGWRSLVGCSPWDR